VTRARPDPKLRQAVDASLAWYDDVFALHRIPARRSASLWSALADPPPYHSTVKTVLPGVPADQVLEASAPLGAGSVADSFGDLELPGFRKLFEATWLHHPGGSGSTLPAGWSLVSRPETLTRWCELHDYVGVLPAAVLGHPRFTVLARLAGDELVGGAVLHDGAEAVGLSNAWAVADHRLDHRELLAVAHAIHPDRAITDYATGDEVASMLDAGFRAVGPQVVWVR
jgi:hypothetical protein